MPNLVVIMPAKNASGTIVSALTSTLRALPTDAEIRVWDDGSTDDTAALAASLDSKYVKVTRSDVSVGGGLARQALIDASDSEFIACMDSDDVCLPWRFRHQMPLVQDSDLVFSAAIRFDPRARRFRPTLPFRFSPDETPKALLYHNPLFQPAMVARRSSVADIGGYRDLKVAQDYELWLRAAAGELSLTRTGVPVILYRESAGQTSQQPDYAKRIKGSPEIREAYFALLTAVFPQIKERAINPHEVTSQDRAVILQLLHFEAKNFGRGKKRYYEGLIKGDRLEFPF
jgi:glycosyltransferase involved in cell wall biosynthesis